MFIMCFVITYCLFRKRKKEMYNLKICFVETKTKSIMERKHVVDKKIPM